LDLLSYPLLIFYTYLPIHEAILGFAKTVHTTNYKKQKKFEKKISRSSAQGKILLVDENH